MTNNDPPTDSHPELSVILDRLTGVAAAPTTDQPGWVAEVQAAAREAVDALQAHTVTSEAEGGILPEMTGRKPSLMASRARLEHEHTDMLHRAEEIEIEAERQLAFEDYNVELLRLQVGILRDILHLHLLRTDALVFEAFFRDEGGGD
jgi:hypothetical protein